MLIKTSLIKGFKRYRELNALPPYQMWNYVQLANSVAWNVESILKNSKCEVSIFRKRKDLKYEPKFTKRKIRFYLPILSKKFSFSFRVESNCGFGVEDFNLIEVLIIVYNSLFENFMKIKFTDEFLFSLYPSLQNSIASLSISSYASSHWKKEIGRYVVDEIIEFLHKLSKKSYEGNPAEIAVAVIPIDMDEKASRIRIDSTLLDSKKTSAFFIGHRHLFKCNIEGFVIGIETLAPHPDCSFKDTYFAPYECQPILEFSRINKCLIFILNRYAEIFVIFNGLIVFSWHEDVWRLFPHKKYIDTLIYNMKKTNEIWKNEHLGYLAIYIGMLALSLRHRRKGGLIVIGNESQLHSLLQDDTLISSDVEELYQSFVSRKFLLDLPISLVCNILSIDGATLITTSLEILRFGVILNTQNYKSGSEGARTRAAEFSSHYGISIKVSEDGPVTVYRNGKIVLDLI